jgi:hypothetical protein
VRTWDHSHLAGGPVDGVFIAIIARFPSVRIERLAVTHPGDDDNVYWIRTDSVEVQVDTCPGGRPPYFVEDDYTPVVAVSDTAALYEILLQRLTAR